MTPEQRVIGAVLRGFWTERARFDPLPMVAFEERFHAVVYQAVLLQDAFGMPVTPGLIWAIIERSAAATGFGLNYLSDLSATAYGDEADAWDDMALLMERAAHRCFVKAAELVPSTVAH